MLTCEWPPTAGLLTLVTVPIRDTVPAVLGLVQRKGQKMTSPDMKLALSIADQSGARLENALLTQAMMSRIRLETEMTVARQVQMTLMPHMLASVPGIDVYGVSVPASQVGGDFFNALPIRGKEFLFYIGDITGKGIPAALMMSMTRTVANSLVRAVPSITPAELVTRINAELGDDFSNVGMFTTLFAGQYQPETRRLDFTNAGHSPVLYAPANQKTRLLVAEDLPVGIINDTLFSQSYIELNVGDVLVLATDGFNESWNSAREMYGMERLEELLEEVKGATALEISAHIFRAVEDFSSGHSADDDRTMLVLKAAPMDGTTLITIPATLVELSSVSAALQNLLMRTYGHTLEAQYAYSCELALQELLSNQVIHACLENAELQIDILLEVKAEERLFVMQTYDEGQPNQIDLAHVNMPDPESLSEGGYGLALIHALADEFTYQREGSMNHWKIVKTIPG
jgi:serine phosphatase RsbU (regulator of sigma subunit)/anti-sigma regulatory factor (Ser/Thr protein kinase)